MMKKTILFITSLFILTSPGYGKDLIKELAMTAATSKCKKADSYKSIDPERIGKLTAFCMEIAKDVIEKTPEESIPLVLEKLTSSEYAAALEKAADDVIFRNNGESMSDALATKKNEIINYLYGIAPQEINTVEMDEVKNIVILTACSSNTLYTIQEYGGTLLNKLFKGSDGEKIGSISVTKEDCAKLQ